MLFTVLQGVGCALGLLGLIAAGVFAWSEHEDRRTLRDIATRVISGIDAPGARLDALNAWVYSNQGFAPNRRHFLVPRLGPTPVQVLQYGGDCANKSRLLSAMLETIGMRSSLAMLYPAPGAAPVHTVVMADLGSVVTLADPVFDITFPRAQGAHVAVQDLVRDPRLLADRLHVLRALRGPEDKIMLYSASNHRLDHVTTVNWSASRLTRAVAHLIRQSGAEPRYVFRPMFLENPKRALTYASLLMAVLGLCVVLMSTWLTHGLAR